MKLTFPEDQVTNDRVDAFLGAPNLDELRKLELAEFHYETRNLAAPMWPGMAEQAAARLRRYGSASRARRIELNDVLDARLAFDRERAR